MLKLAIVYLGTFALTSTLVMGTYAAMYGSFSLMVLKGSASSDMTEFRINVFSASLSILVGILIVILLYLGILHDIFP